MYSHKESQNRKECHFNSIEVIPSGKHSLWRENEIYLPLCTAGMDISTNQRQYLMFVDQRSDAKPPQRICVDTRRMPFVERLL